eukprot:4229201-Pleurochrysis_carterae.AAC.1
MYTLARLPWAPQTHADCLYEVGKTLWTVGMPKQALAIYDQLLASEQYREARARTRVRCKSAIHD